jgi:hypothetical protein
VSAHMIGVVVTPQQISHAGPCTGSFSKCRPVPDYVCGHTVIQRAVLCRLDLIMRCGHTVTQCAVLRAVRHRLLRSWTRAPCRSPLLVGSGLVMQLRAAVEMRAARQVRSASARQGSAGVAAGLACLDCNQLSLVAGLL